MRPDEIIPNLVSKLKPDFTFVQKMVENGQNLVFCQILQKKAFALMKSCCHAYA